MFKLKQDQNEIKFGEGVELDIDIKAKDVYGNDCIIEKGTIGYMSNYHLATFADGNMIYNSEELKCNGEVDNYGIASYIYDFLCEELSLEEMMNLYKIPRYKVKKAIKEVLKKSLTYTKEYNADGEYFVFRVDNLKLTGSIYRGMKTKFPLTGILRSSNVSKDELRAGILKALDRIFFNFEREDCMAKDFNKLDLPDNLAESYEIVRLE